jgi:hypothetical protein
MNNFMRYRGRKEILVFSACYQEFNFWRVCSKLVTMFLSHLLPIFTVYTGVGIYPLKLKITSICGAKVLLQFILLSDFSGSFTIYYDYQMRVELYRVRAFCLKWMVY